MCASLLLDALCSSLELFLDLLVTAHMVHLYELVRALHAQKRPVAVQQHGHNALPPLSRHAAQQLELDVGQVLALSLLGRGFCDL